MKQSPSKESNSFSGTQAVLPFVWNTKVVTIFTIARHLSLTWATRIRSKDFLPIYIRSILIFCSRPCFGLPESAGSTSRNMQWTGTPFPGSGPMFLNLLVLLHVQARSQLCETHIEIAMSVCLYE